MEKNKYTAVVLLRTNSNFSARIPQRSGEEGEEVNTDLIDRENMSGSRRRAHLARSPSAP